MFSLSLSLSMASNCSLCIVGAMDRLWFHQIVLLSEPISLLVPKTLETPQPISESLTYPSSSLSLSPLPVEEIPSAVSLVPDEEISSADDSNNEEEERERSTNLIDLTKTRARSHSFSLSTQKRPKILGSSSVVIRRLHKTMSCKNLGDLELEEIKGFMDLGFTFKKEHLSPRMMSVIPGLQRLGASKNKQNAEHELIDVAEIVKEDETELRNEKRVTTTRRPYLSEAWLIKRPDSPLLNLRMPRDVSEAADMKKHLRFWARTVASVLEQES